MKFRPPFMVQTSLKHQEKPSEYLIYSPLLHIMTNRPPCRYYEAVCRYYHLEQAGDETHLQLVGQPHVLTGPGLTRQLDVSTISA